MTNQKSFCSALILFVLIASTPVAMAQNPFLSKKEPSAQQAQRRLMSPHPIFVKLALWQKQLRDGMADLIEQARKDRRVAPLMYLLLLAYCYGVLHAAGPGHGKAVAMSYILSSKISVLKGVLFGFLIAIFHGFSGAICVLGLSHVLKKSISGTLQSVTNVTQIVSLALIVLLGIGILVKNGWQLYSNAKKKTNIPRKNAYASNRRTLPWAMVFGLVPCPGVVMVMLFCLSMDLAVLGLILAACVSLGMATTIVFAVTLVTVGKAGIFKRVSENRTETIEGIVGILSGGAIAVFGALFLMTALIPAR
jgi:ABC-type nickel/cobalt efflux system permease component RcnA